MSRIRKGPSAPVVTATETDWRRAANCRKQDPELFFPVSETTLDGLRQIRDAKTVCSTCTVWRDCLGFADEIGADCGIFGGLTGRERRLEAARARRKALDERDVA
jgi:WhiB family redox-sensing transcriptional regulator